MMNAKNLIEQEYPLSFYIWQNDYKSLKNLLATPRGQVGSCRMGKSSPKFAKIS